MCMFETRSVGIQPSGQVRRVGMREPYRHRRRIRREKARARMHCSDAQYGGIMKVTQLLIEAPMFGGDSIDVYCRAQARTTTSGTHRDVRSSFAVPLRSQTQLVSEGSSRLKVKARYI